jgi:hypothetical protein
VDDEDVKLLAERKVPFEGATVDNIDVVANC